MKLAEELGIGIANVQVDRDTIQANFFKLFRHLFHFTVARVYTLEASL